jgi:hypothetical protein
MKVTYSEYSKFHNSIIKKSRYAFDKRTKAFLEYLLSTSEKMIKILHSETILFRTQRGHDEVEDNYQLIVLPYKKDRMLPKANSARNGRVNPVGMPVIYLSDDKLTAVQETRPWIKETISLARFRTLKDLKILDLSMIESDTHFYLKEPKDKVIIGKKIWSDVSAAFSRPVTIDDQDIGYIPTQVIGEYFKVNGFDGICYKSFLGNGKNYAIFDINAVEIKNGIVLEVKSIKLEIEQYGNPVEYMNKGNDRIYNVIDFIKPIDTK